MTRDEMLKVLKDSFKDFKFFEDGHYYEYKGKRVGISVTRLIEEYCNEFDSQAVAEKVAEKNLKNYEYAKTQLQLYNPLEIGGNDCLERYDELKKMLEFPITVADVLNEWQLKNDIACEKGHFGHLYAQSLWNGEIYQEHIKDGLETVKIPLEKIKQQADNFYNDYKDKLEHLGDEVVVGSYEYDIASAIDHLFYNKLTGGLVLVDYKTNSILKGYNDDIKNRKYTKKMKVPLHKIDDDALHHYYIQLSIYKFLIEKYTGLKVDEMFIVYMSENIENYEIIEIPYLKEEVEKILENRRVKNMNSLGILLMGGSGTGKSTSLRNLPAEETAIINVTNKPMPFRNKNGIKIVNCNNYEQMIKAILGTKKRIIVVDDSSYMMTFENFDKATNKGYDKFTTMAVNYYDLITTPQKCDGEKIIYFITHEEVNEDMVAKPKTIGKMLSQQLVIEGLFTVVLRSMLKNNEYVFQTHNDGTSVCKSPIDMFEEDFIPNDLAEVDKIIREYYGFKPIDEKIEEV